LLPTDPRASARANQICGIVDCYVFPQVSATIGFQRLILPIMGGTTDESVVAAALPNAERCVSVLDGLLAERPFLAGDQISIADLMAAPHLEFLSMTPEGERLLKGTALQAWLLRMQARDSMKATTPQALGGLPKA
jgi:glutathione S-transferase